jgi:WD40 repeat protein
MPILTDGCSRFLSVLLAYALVGCSDSSGGLFVPVPGPGELSMGNLGSGGSGRLSLGDVAGAGGVGGRGLGTGGGAGLGGTSAVAVGLDAGLQPAQGGRTGSVPDAGTAPDEVDAGSVVEPVPVCDPCPCSTGLFGEPELVTGLGLDVPVFGPMLSADGLTLYFSAVDGDEDIYTATRTDRGLSFSSARPVPELDDDGSEEGTPFLSFDGLSVYFFSTRPGPDTLGNRDIWQARRTSASAAFSEPFVVPGVNGAALDHLPRLSQNELRLTFVSGRESPNLGSNLWIAERDSRDEEFSEPVELAGVNGPTRDEGFSFSSDELTLFFASNRVIAEDMDIWVTQRSNRGGQFAPAENLSVVNTDALELDPGISTDGFELFFVSTRNGEAEIFRSARICE